MLTHDQMVELREKLEGQVKVLNEILAEAHKNRLYVELDYHAGQSVMGEQQQPQYFYVNEFSFEIRRRNR